MKKVKFNVEQIGVESGLLFQRDKLSYEEQRFAELIIDRCCAELLRMHDYAAPQHNFYKHASIMLKDSFESKICE